MTDSLFIIGVVALIASILYLVIKTIIESIKEQLFHRENRKAQFSGSAVDEREGSISKVFASRYENQAEKIGEYGERRVSSFMEDLPKNDYWVFNDLLIRTGNYTTQIDHIIISRYGVFVIETKNVHGKVYGNEKSEFWKQYLPDEGYKRYGSAQEHQLRNPIWQNEGHIKSLRRLVFDNDIPIYGIVVFPNETQVNVTSEQPVLKMIDIVPYIKGYRDTILSSAQMASYRKRLLEVITRTTSDRKIHLDNVVRNQERRNVAVANGKCPRCGGSLVPREGKYGRFYGCSNYPKCTYSINN